MLMTLSSLRDGLNTFYVLRWTCTFGGQGNNAIFWKWNAPQKLMYSKPGSQPVDYWKMGEIWRSSLVYSLGHWWCAHNGIVRILFFPILLSLSLSLCLCLFLYLSFLTMT
jgi:hypothetical protein